MTVPKAKTELRRTMRARLKCLTGEERAAMAEVICQRVLAEDFWKSASVVLLFAPLLEEVNIWPLAIAALSEGKTVTLPRFDSSMNRYLAAQVKNIESDLIPGAFGIREPARLCSEIPLATIDLALVPGLAFDTAGRRLGRGKGFYDELLTGFGGIKCGVALDEQLVGEIPTEPHDLPMDVVITSTKEIIGICPGGTR